MDQTSEDAGGSPAEVSLYEQLGGAAKLRQVIDCFVDKIFSDAMIGFLFRRVDRQRLKDKEFEFAAKHLGAPISYSGEPLQSAHRKHSIMGGQFARRLHILRETLHELAVPAPVIDHWLSHTEKLRPLITSDPSDQCRGSPGESISKPVEPEIRDASGARTVKLRRG